MFDISSASSFISFISRRCRQSEAARFANRNGDTMLGQITKSSWSSKRIVAVAATFFILNILPAVFFVAFSTTRALACACGCSVFDVGGLGAPQEQDQGGRVFFEFWDGYQYQNYVGSSRAPSSLNTDKVIDTQWYNVGFEYQLTARRKCAASCQYLMMRS